MGLWSAGHWADVDEELQAGGDEGANRSFSAAEALKSTLPLMEYPMV